MNRPFKRSKPGKARGFTRGNMTRLMCSFDKGTFDAVFDISVKDGVPMVETVRCLVEWGLMAYEEQE